MTKTSIEWTERVWNPFAGCSVLSPGCTNCYAMKMARRIEACNAGLRQGHGGSPHYAGTTKIVNGNAVWTGKIGIASDEVLLAPLRRKRPTTYFVNSMSDLFHESVPDEWIDKVFAVMALTPQHTYQVLTKRSARMRAYCASRSEPKARLAITGRMNAMGAGDKYPIGHRMWPLPNVWLGVSTERQKEADERIPDLLATPAAVRFISAEPLLGPIDFTSICTGHYFIDALRGVKYHDAPEGVHRATERCAKLNQIIIGGESGRDARPMHPEWPRWIRNDCAAANVAFFFKQWGEFAPRMSNLTEFLHPSDVRLGERVVASNGALNGFPDHGVTEFEVMRRLGKKAAGRLLDGVEHNAMPEAAR